MCIIIAEAGENHLGDMEIAKRLVDLSKAAGVDYVKFQYYNAEDCSNDDPEKDWFRKVQLDLNKVEYLYRYAEASGIEFLCTPWDVKKADELFSIGIKDMKIASFHITDSEMLRITAQKARRVFLSTGMSSVEEIDHAVSLLRGTDLYLLHCVSEYPLPEEHVNILSMDFLRERYGCHVGYSDHTLGILAPMVAVARGADVIEKHITLSKTFFGTDHILSADPAELRLLVEHVARIKSMLGNKEKKITETEFKQQNFLRNRFTYGNQ